MHKIIFLLALYGLSKAETDLTCFMQAAFIPAGNETAALMFYAWKGDDKCSIARAEFDKLARSCGTTTAKVSSVRPANVSEVPLCSAVFIAFASQARTLTALVPTNSSQAMDDALKLADCFIKNDDACKQSLSTWEISALVISGVCLYLCCAGFGINYCRNKANRSSYASM